ncbi:hypothetical protein ILYODFUR_001178 [Ilyodon furcidens]|uniref:Uncharacterized protein n=1 Tax=Ilyodon furcidens TaxID=33524 RepID=A0ABV0TF37_9TELE
MCSNPACVLRSSPLLPASAGLTAGGPEPWPLVATGCMGLLIKLLLHGGDDRLDQQPQSTAELREAKADEIRSQKSVSSDTFQSTADRSVGESFQLEADREETPFAEVRPPPPPPAPAPAESGISQPPLALALLLLLLFDVGSFTQRDLYLCADPSSAPL